MEICASVRALGVAIGVSLLLTACGGGSGGSAAPPATPIPALAPPGVLSLSGTPRLDPYPASVQQWDARYAEAADLAYAAGARGQVLTYTWSGLEPAPGRYDTDKLAQLRNAIDAAQARGVATFLGLQVINTSVKELPADLAGLPFDHATVLKRFHALLDQVMGTVPGRLRYLAIGNEVDAYLGAHPGEATAYQRFYRDALQYAHGLDPAVQVGVAGTAAGALGGEATLLRELNAMGSDVVVLTYYPMQFDAQGVATVKDPSVVASDFRQMLAFAGGKRLVLQEAGYPASAGTQSSEARQAEFLRQLFTAWQAADGAIPFLNVFLLHDLTPQTCEQLLAYYGRQGNASLGDFLCSLGLRRADGTPRPAWQVLVDEAQRVRLP